MKKIKVKKKLHKIAYAGSTIQQSHGETDDKGFLVWEIQDKDKFNVRHVSVSNPKPFVTIELSPEGKLPDSLDIPPGSRLRLVANDNFSVDVIRKNLDIVRSKLKPENLTFINRAEEKSSVLQLPEEYKKEDLRNLQVQERLIKEFLKDYKIDDSLLKKVFEINKKYNSIAEENEPIARNVDFELLKLEWNNLFNYGSNNSVNFEKLSGIVGIFGKNYSGKSSVIDSLLYVLFNSITKKSKKSVNIINMDSTDGSGKVLLRVGKNTYRIQRKSEKYIKKLHKVETVEAKTSVNFEMIDPVTGDVVENYNGIDRIETDKNINKLFGSIDDFLLTSMSSQLGSLSYIDKGSTERKENLAKFLDLEFFAQKFKLANDDAGVIKSSLKRYDNKDLYKDLEEVEDSIIENETNTTSLQSEIENLKNSLLPLEKDLLILEDKLSKSPTKIIDIESVQSGIESREKKIRSLLGEHEEYSGNISENEKKIAKADDFISKFDIDSLKKKDNDSKLLEKQISDVLSEIKDQTKALYNDSKKVDLLKEVPCGSEYSHCKFIKGAYEAQENINLINIVLENKKSEKIKLEESLNLLDSKKNKQQIEKYLEFISRHNMLVKETDALKLKIANKNSGIVSLERELDKLKLEQDEYFKNKELIDNYESFLKEKNIKQKEINSLKSTLISNEKKLSDLYKLHGSLEQKLNKIKEEQLELDNLNKEFEAYDLFLKSMHSNGISYDIIKKSLPAINNEIAKNLANIVNFEVYFQNEENRLELYIKHPDNKDVLPIEMASVAQKTLAAMAIRLAFIHVSSLPKANVFILDEPGTSLDEDSIQGFIRMLDMIKNHFKCVILISHLEALKEVADTTITIQKNGGFASVNN